jgi:hypothetical protein
MVWFLAVGFLNNHYTMLFKITSSTNGPAIFDACLPKGSQIICGSNPNSRK